MTTPNNKQSPATPADLMGAQGSATTLNRFEERGAGCPVQVAKGLTVKELIKMGIFDQHTAIDLLSQNATLTGNEPEYVPIVVGELYEHITSIRSLQRVVHDLNKAAGWWTDLDTGLPKDRNPGELLMLVVTEVAESMEGVRKNCQDDKLPSRKMEEVELADAVIRILDYCGGRNLDLAGALIEKLTYNTVREDHTIAARQAEGGKKL